MTRHAHGNGDEVDCRIFDHLIDTRISTRCPERRRNLIGGFLSLCSDSSQLQALKAFDRGNVGDTGPTTRRTDSNNADSNYSRHTCSLSEA